MLDFKHYQQLSEEFDLNTMDLEFLKRAEKVTAFNITAKDFETLRYKAEIQHLFNKHFFPKFKLENTSSAEILSLGKIPGFWGILEDILGNILDGS